MNTVRTDDARLFNDSLERCMSQAGFFERFYEVFLGSSDEVKEIFQHTDFKRQVVALKASLYVLMMASTGDPNFDSLKRIAEQHSRHELNIRPELYDLWLKCLLQVAGEYDRNWDEPTKAAWQHVLAYGIEFMKARY